jgi:subtilisin family serine protease
MRRLLIAALALTACLFTFAKGKEPVKKTYIYRYYLTDKKASKHSLQRPSAFLSQKSLDRRRRQGLRLDSTDLPVPERYVRQFQGRDTRVLGTSRWQNTVVVSAPDSAVLVRLASLPMVRKAQCVYVSPDSLDSATMLKRKVHTDFDRWDSVKNDHYGMARRQIEMLDGVKLHEAGFTGRGITIAILDGGFMNYDQIPALQHARIRGTYDFVEQAVQGPTFHDADHGTKVLSAIAAYAPEVIVGTAPDADIWLLRSEDTVTEQPVEEDYWAMAAEYADSLGADVLNSSLGYYEYDAPMPSYRLRDLDGRTAFISREASMLASKGMILCNSAGNSGMGHWKKIGVPADSHDILAVGAVDGEGLIAPFSSVGPSQDLRTKPDVVARGSNTALISGRGRLVSDMGTSFSSPVTCGMVACLWQALPQLTALQVMELVRQSGDQHDAPNNVYGNGLPSFWNAYQHGK